MDTFNWKVFRYTFGVTLPIIFTIAWSAVVVLHLSYSLEFVVLAILFSISISAPISFIIASYGFHRILFIWTYCRVMRSLAKKAIRSSLSHAMAKIECTGILERYGEVALQIRAGTSDGILQGYQFNVYEATDNQLWGRVEVVNARYYDCDCIPYDKVNVEFWTELENRMRYNTEKSPNIHLFRELPVTYLME